MSSRINLKTVSNQGTRSLYAFLILALLLSFAGFYSVSAAGSIYYVDKTNLSCSDNATGLTPALPFCTIAKAASVAAAGDTIQVLAGSYAETVTVPQSGSAGLPITYSAVPGVIITGNGSTSGGNAFYISNKSYITINGFTINGTADDGIYVSSSNHIILSSNHVGYAGNPVSGSTRGGIYLTGTTDSTITGNTTDHNTQDGIRLTSGSSNNVVSNNVSFANAEQWQRNATGIQVYGSSSYGNTFLHNITYANEDSGFQFYKGAHDNFVIGNLSYGNGDHGIDCSYAPYNDIIGNTFQGNHTAGINLEGDGAPGGGGASVLNNISVDNGIDPITGQKSNIRVDASSIGGTTLDYNLVYLSGASTVQIQWNDINYATLSDFQLAVPGQEVHGIQANPLFVSPVPPASRPAAEIVGDYHLLAGSPAIDSANADAPYEPDQDLDGYARMDDPATTDTGAGFVTYYDRGAYEFQLDGGLPTLTPQPATFTPTITPTMVDTATFTPTGTSSPTATTTFTLTPSNTPVPPTPTSTLTPSNTPVPPTVDSVTRVNPNPTNAASVDFTVSFTEPVTGVDTSDFSLTSTVTGASITSVSGSGNSYTVTVNTGSGDGTIRLDVVDDDSIVDGAGNPLGGIGMGNGNYTVGETYSVQKHNGDTTGVFRPSNGLLYLKNTNSTGFADVAINYGTGGDYPVTGDWDGNGTATIGIYRNGSFLPAQLQHAWLCRPGVCLWHTGRSAHRRGLEWRWDRHHRSVPHFDRAIPVTQQQFRRSSEMKFLSWECGGCRYRRRLDCERL